MEVDQEVAEATVVLPTHTAFLWVRGKVEGGRYSFFAHLGYLFVEFGIAVGHGGEQLLFVGWIGHFIRYLGCKDTFFASEIQKNRKRHVIMEATGRSATDWIERCVIMDAKAQLSSTQKRVSEISDDLSFASPSFFGKYFKRITGLSPRAFREAEKPYVS